jgi:peptide/nickel transport system permease protein
MSSAPRHPSAGRRFRLTPAAAAGTVILGAFYLIALFGGFVAPYSQEAGDRARFYQPPQRLHWIDEGGRFHPLPFVRPMMPAGGEAFAYAEDGARRLPLRFLVRGDSYRWLGLLRSDRHLFGVDAPERVRLLGADGFGRDVFSRLVYGSQISLTIGLIGIAISFSIGMLLGGISGYLGGWVDTLVMRLCELLLSIPGIYLILALRSVFPVDLPSPLVYLGIVSILSLVGWASLARVVRGLVLTLRESEFVVAAEALGIGRLRILVRHILPNTLSFVVVAATLSIPGYLLGEVVLSFLGVGVQEPAASWGNMLIQARSLRVLSSFPWLLYAPGAAIVLTVMAYNFVGDGLRDALDPRASVRSRW